jgi:hypothetical protein
MMLPENRPYKECKGKRRHNLSLHGMISLVEGGKLHTVPLEIHPSDKSLDLA